MQAAANDIEGGFADAVMDAQRVFKAVMNAMARPGTTEPVPALAAPPAPLTHSAAAVLLALCDHDTPIWLDGALGRSQAVRSWIGFNTGAPFADDPRQAHFAVIEKPERLDLSAFHEGEPEYPDRSATLILQVDSLSGGTPLRLRGPGIETVAMLAPQPLPADFVDQWQANRVAFPLGVDLILAAPDALACLPRTVRINENGEG